MQKTDYLKKTESMEKGFVCPYNQRDNPAWITQGSSLGDRWTMGQDIKVGLRRANITFRILLIKGSGCLGN